MLPKIEYFVNDNPQDDGYHEVHSTGCRCFKWIKSHTSLGHFSTCQEAVDKAKKIYSKSDGCYWCTNACHRL